MFFLVGLTPADGDDHAGVALLHIFAVERDELRPAKSSRKSDQ
jgi:hypothetical protein